MTDEKTPDTPTEEVPITPSLPFRLPEFEGIIPVGVVTKITGTGQRITRPLHYGERGVLVVEYEVANVAHGKTADGMKRIQTLTVDDFYELEGKAGTTLLRSLRQAYKIADDRRSGREPLEGNYVEPTGSGLEVTVDGHGNVLTSSEAAAARGEVLEGLPHVDVAVLVFEDESRALWPDDFADATGPHPEAGERIRKPGAKAKDEPVLIRQVLDADTGEELEVWTDEQEAERIDAEAAIEEKVAAERAGVADDLDLVEKAAQKLLTGPDGWRAFGSIKTDLAGYTNLPALTRAHEIETGARARKNVLAALDERIAELRG